MLIRLQSTKICKLIIKKASDLNGSLSNRIGEELLGEALTVVTQLMLLFDLREKYNQCD